MKRLLALFLLVCSLLVARIVDAMSAILGTRLEAVDAVDAWFRSSDSRLLCWLSEGSPEGARPTREVQTS
jgi:hypothetical protein